MQKEDVKSIKLVLEYEYDFVLLGIFSSAKDYTLAWYINLYCSVNLSRREEIDIHYKTKGHLLFTLFVHETEASSMKIIKNRAVEFMDSEKPFLIPELKDYDYFLLLEGDFAYHCIENFELIKTIPVVQYVKTLEFDHLPSKENLLI